MRRALFMALTVLTDVCGFSLFADAGQDAAAQGPPTVTKTVSEANPAVGDEVTYTVNLTGTAPPPSGTSMRDSLPAGLEIVGQPTCVVAPPTACFAFAANNVVTADIFPIGLDPEFDATVTYTVRVTGGVLGPITNTACLVAANGSDCASSTITVAEPVPGAWGDLSKDVDVTTAEPGDPVTYTVTLPYTANDGGIEAAYSFDLSDMVPDELSDVTWTCTGVNISCDPGAGSGNEINVSGVILDETQPGSVTLTITGMVGDDVAPGEVTNQACKMPSATIVRTGIRAFAQTTNCASATLAVGADSMSSVPTYSSGPPIGPLRATAPPGVAGFPLPDQIGGRGNDLRRIWQGVAHAP